MKKVKQNEKSSDHRGKVSRSDRDQPQEYMTGKELAKGVVKVAAVVVATTLIVKGSRIV